MGQFVSCCRTNVGWAGGAGVGLTAHDRAREVPQRGVSATQRDGVSKKVLPPACQGNCSAAGPGLTDCGSATPAWLTQAESSWEAKPDKGACGHFCPSAIEAREAGGSEARWAGLAAGVDTCLPSTPAPAPKSACRLL